MNVSASNSPSSNGSDSPRPSAARSVPRVRRARRAHVRREHLGALVDADDGPRRRRARELDRDGGGPAGDVDDARRIRRDARDEELAAPARSWPNESSRAYRSYVGPSGANNSRASSVLGESSAKTPSLFLVGGTRRDLERIAAAAAGFAAPEERVSAVVAAEPLGAGRVYLCAYESGDGHVWLALDDAGAPIASRRLVREAASLAALCEVAEDVAGIEPGPRVATPAYLDELGARAQRGRRLRRGGTAGDAVGGRARGRGRAHVQGAAGVTARLQCGAWTKE